MIKHICDRCGNVLLGHKYIVCVSRMDIKTGMHDVFPKEVELCEKCVKDFDRFMEGQDK